ncbi:MAG: ATP-binding protein [Gemmatimonadales bacterium]
MDAPDLLLRLAGHRLLGTAPHGELEWLAAHGELRQLAPGEVTTQAGQPEEWLYVVLSGHIAIHLDRGAGSRKIIEWRDGDVLGLLPYSRGGKPPGPTRAEQPTDILALHRQFFPEMIRECPAVTARLVHSMLDRARHFTSSDLHDEKLVSLGKLAAGLAHELNNPASAAARSAKLLSTGLSDAESAARALAAAGLSEAQLAAIDDVRAQCAWSPGAHQRTPMERADREDAMGSWLGAHGVDDTIAASLTETNLTTEALDTLAATVSERALAAALQWIAAGSLLRTLAADIETSASRIYDLVAAVKGFTYMDLAATSEPTDIRRGIADTLTVLGAKTQAKSVTVTVSLASDLPRIRAFGAELNQVWANLIDNALDAVGPSGHVDVSARREGDRLVVSIVDDGHGVPAELHGRIFDPFFTTKGVGQGTGLGLDIVRRLLKRHDGEIEVVSRPGRTECKVSLPVVTP